MTDLAPAVDPFELLAERYESRGTWEVRLSWEKIARKEQLPPEGDWVVWLFLGGRGAGKTRSGAEWIAERARNIPKSRNALVAPTLDDVRDTMVEGESGLLSVLEPSELRGGSIDTAWNRSMCELYLANGSKFKGFSSQKPSKLRGPQHHSVWVDEPMSFKDAKHGPEKESTTWSNMILGLRLGKDPRCVVTGTPKRLRLLVGHKEGEVHKPGIMDQAGTAVTKGVTYDNLENLAPTFKENILALYEGTRTGRQELNAEILEDVEGALWTNAMIEEHRVSEAPELVRIVVAVDPAGSNTEDSDETGIIVAGKGVDGRAYVLTDASGKFFPHDWGSRVVNLYDQHEADRVVAEKNYGGDMVESTVRTVRRDIPFKGVSAKRNKQTRAEPISALYEQGKVSHVGAMSTLEDQLTTWVPDTGQDSPDRLDALVYALTSLMLDAKKGGGMRFRQ